MSNQEKHESGYLGIKMKSDGGFSGKSFKVIYLCLLCGKQEKYERTGRHRSVYCFGLNRPAGFLRTKNGWVIASELFWTLKREENSSKPSITKKCDRKLKTLAEPSVSAVKDNCIYQEPSREPIDRLASSIFWGAPKE